MPVKFIKLYSAALASQDWNQVAPLIHPQAGVTFSDGSVHKGINNIKLAYERNFSIIKSEHYAIENINWLKRESNYAAFIFEYQWTGIINEKHVSGGGVGSSVIINENGSWQLLSEHLGKKKSL